MKRTLPRPIFIYLKIPLEVLVSKMTDPNRQYSSQVFRFEESIHVLFSQANFPFKCHYDENFACFFSLDFENRRT